jgi:hypothetical protein
LVIDPLSFSGPLLGLHYRNQGMSVTNEIEFRGFGFQEGQQNAVHSRAVKDQCTNSERTHLSTSLLGT